MMRISGRVMHCLVPQSGEAVSVFQLPGVAHGGHGTAGRAERMVVIRSGPGGGSHRPRAGQQHGVLVVMVTVQVGGGRDD